MAIPTVASAHDRAAEIDKEHEEVGDLTDEQADEVHDRYHAVGSGERRMSVPIGIAVLAMAVVQ